MEITFHGAAKTVTGSKHLIKMDNGQKVLLDCGLFQGGGEETKELNQHLGFNPKAINAVILSHAHIDHCGLLPKLVVEGFNGNIYATPATIDLATILLKDSAKIQEDDVKYINKRRKEKELPLIEPLYTSEDVEKVLPLFKENVLNKTFEVVPNMHCTFTEAGHILGSAVVNLEIKDANKIKRVCFSGDVGRYNDPILKAPAIFPQADIIICESTYGDSLHDDIAISDQELLKEIEYTCIQKKGNLIIPAFSVGRTQEIVYALNRLDIQNRLPKIKFYVDSPLSFNATEVTKKHTECFNKSLLEYMKKDNDPFGFSNLIFITDVEESKALNSHTEPCVILSASGMADAGRVKHHIAINIENPKNTILIVGYCEPNTLGARLQKNLEKVKIFGEFYEIKADIHKIRSFSAHGDYQDLCQFLACQNPELVEHFFIVHGEPEVQEHFKNKLLKKGFNSIEIPEIHESFHV